MNSTSQNKNWGGKRANSGRKPSKVKAKPKTKTCRVTFETCDFIKSGKMSELHALIQDWYWDIKMSPEASSSPRWEQMRRFMKEVEGICGVKNEQLDIPD